MNKPVFIAYIPCPDQAVAKKLAVLLLEKQLIACANLHKVQSLYNWNGALQDEEEVVIVAKTLEHQVEEIKELMSAFHPYEVPALLFWPLSSVNAPYYQWINQQIPQ